MGVAEIGESLPNCAIPDSQMKGFVTTAEAIADLPPVEAGEEASHYTGPPEGAYQSAMRSGLNGQLTNHYAARLSPANLARLALSSRARIGVTCPGICCRGACSGRCARITPAGTAG